jgi:hypothetical protein
MPRYTGTVTTAPLLAGTGLQEFAKRLAGEDARWAAQGWSGNAQESEATGELEREGEREMEMERVGMDGEGGNGGGEGWEQHALMPEPSPELGSPAPHAGQASPSASPALAPLATRRENRSTHAATLQRIAVTASALQVPEGVEEEMEEEMGANPPPQLMAEDEHMHAAHARAWALRDNAHEDFDIPDADQLEPDPARYTIFGNVPQPEDFGNAGEKVDLFSESLDLGLSAEELKENSRQAGNGWLVELYEHWVKKFSSFAGSALQGKAMLEELMALKYEIPAATRTVEHWTAFSGNAGYLHPPSYLRVLEDLRTQEGEVTAVDLRTGAVGKQPVIIVLGSLITHAGEYNPATALGWYGAVEIPATARDGLGASHLRLPRLYKEGDNWRKVTKGDGPFNANFEVTPFGTLMPGAATTDWHYDGFTALYGVNHGKQGDGKGPWKLWLMAPMTAHNMRIMRNFYPGGREPALSQIVIRHLEGMRYILVTPTSNNGSWIFPPGTIHAVLTFELSSHCNWRFFDLDHWPMARALLDVQVGMMEQLGPGQERYGIAEVLKEEIEGWLRVVTERDSRQYLLTLWQAMSEVMESDLQD